MLKLFKVTFLLSLCFMLTSCATIVTGKHQVVPVTTQPPGATAMVNGQTIITPGSFTLERDKSYTIVIKKEGYVPQTVTLTKTISGAVAGNILFGGIIGGGIDMVTGAAYKLVPEEVSVLLTPIKSED